MGKGTKIQGYLGNKNGLMAEPCNLPLPSLGTAEPNSGWRGPRRVPNPYSSFFTAAMSTPKMRIVLILFFLY
jgi:hypothetical protein